MGESAIGSKTLLEAVEKLAATRLGDVEQHDAGTCQ